MILLVLTLFTWEWVETTQEDFRDGWFSRDLYSSHRGDGSVEFVGRFDLNNDDYIDIPGNSWVMWGSSSGYSTNNKTNYSGRGGCDAADLNADGYPEFLTTTMGGSIQVFWGGINGPDPSNHLQIPVDAYNNEGIFAADFNKDGYLDLLASINDGNAAIFWGSAQGYSRSNLTPLPCNMTGYNPEVADLNKDGWLDAIVIAGDTYAGDLHFIYWGGVDGPSPGNFTAVRYGEGGPHGMSVADLNYDGWLDLVYSANIPDYAAILWGGEDTYVQGDTVDADYQLPLPDRAFGGSSIADLDADGYLDIVFFGNDGVPPRIFLGDADGISPSRYIDLGVEFAVGSGGMVADYTGDESLDIVELSYEETVLFHGPDFTSYDVFNVGSHHGFSREIGNVYTREYREEYYSSIFDAERPVRWTRIYWDDSLPGESSISLAVRIGSSPDTSSGWGSWVEVQTGADIPGSLQSQYIQYRATFEYPAPAHLPVLFLVGIEYVLEAIIVRPDQSSAALPGDTVTYQLNIINYTHDSDVVEISQQATQPTWSHDVTDLSGSPLGDSDSDGSPDVGEIEPEGDSTSILAHVGIPLSAEPGERDTLIVYGRSSNSDTLYDSALVVTKVLGVVDIVVDPDQIRSGYPGQDVTFPLWGINYGELPDIINLSAASRHGWDVELLDSAGTAPLTDHNADGVPDLDTLAPSGGTEYFSVRVGVPSSLGAGVADTIYVIGRSSENPEVTDLAMLIITVLETASLEIRPDQTAMVSPETPSVLYGLEVINHGNGPETGDITFNSALNWETVVYDSTREDSLTDSNGNTTPDVGELAAFGGTCSLYVVVKMPADFDPTRGAFDTLAGYVSAIETTRVYVSSASDGVVRDSAILVTSALPGLSVHNFPNPFRDETRIVWSQPEEGDIILRLADRAGRPVATIFSGYCQTGVHSYLWEALTPGGTPLAPGVYILLLEYKPEEGRTCRIPYKMLCTGRGRQ